MPRSTINPTTLGVVLILGLISFPLPAAQSVEEIGTTQEQLTIAFTGHTYPLLLRDLQYYLADRILERDPDLVVLAGDVVPGSDASHLGHGLWNQSIQEEQWDKFSLLRSRLGVPVLEVPGNHEL